jgi:hypothetical protein
MTDDHNLLTGNHYFYLMLMLTLLSHTFIFLENLLDTLNYHEILIGELQFDNL